MLEYKGLMMEIIQNDRKHFNYSFRYEFAEYEELAMKIFQLREWFCVQPKKNIHCKN